jgi:acyl-CoA synthetase (AMP-forming)/AMP-acid ligase II
MVVPAFGTCIDMLAFRARVSAAQTAFSYGGQGCSFSELWEGVNRFAAQLLELSIKPGERVVLALPNSREFFFAFYGTARAGATTVPLFPESSPTRLCAVARLCGARFLVLPSSLTEAARARFEPLAAASGVRIIAPPENDNSSSISNFPIVHPDDVAFIQYTSGSTGNPKGVQLTHANLLTNIGQMIAGMQISKRDIFVSWLPVYHDMGLILMTMVPFYLAADVYLLPTDLRSIGAWLDAIQAHRATFTAAPDFAYRLCLRSTRPGEYDLSSLRVALNAAEPVRASTIDSFESAFGLRNVMVAGYGLAEATVGVSMWTPGTRPRVDARGIVSVGRPFPGIEILILQDGRPAATGQVGEIAIRSLANSRGYFDNPEETAHLFWGDGFILSGDLGYLDSEGYLYVVGRKKNIIKVAGETIAPQEVEEYVDQLPGIRFSVALGIDRGGREGEQLYIFSEVRDTREREEDLHELALRISESVHSHVGYHPGRVYLLRAHSIPRTHNGKIQHARLKQAYLDDSLRAQGAILYPEF